MRIQQLHYIIKIVECGSMNEAAKQLFITQPSLSNAVKDLESEMGITIFIRNPKGITLTKDGVEFLSYARQIIEQTSLLEDRYKNQNTSRELFSVSSQHYAFVVNAFVSLLKQTDMTQYELFLRETRTWEIIDDVKNFRSEIGVLFINDYNRDVLTKLFDDNHLTVTPLFKAHPHIFVSKSNPLASKKLLVMDDLIDFPYLSYDQGIHNSFYFSEEMMSQMPHSKSIVVSDRATLFNLMIGLDGYTVASGILNSNLNGDQIVAIPLDVPDEIDIVFIKHEKANLSKMGERFIEYLLEEVTFD
ncbi:UNVERIFIED_CONTAM: LysR family transcriptional regulator [Streptococcus canis]|uniref:LysR family transcriptional regulator n=1 Tax=Streptococcus canis FSL Z3-227 TaxID=482234 RepID=A0AAV3FTJ8_STRCB|nr:LysR family transcriptional regulator [Streptococcus canis]EIQ82074.1 LysR family transcriptional regulator [Streptococcus canis FSL Z3-227]MDV5989279.1 LysR family transcriptional regulator [Streptococcus canis]MDV5994537.1 LysR family transcriptional regulator [Streptococcus canis]MDV6002057.1 LysR family transcriptional regulator [Streptococcus canis]MDV6023458.1 LysR family transcriptional regulator [Streptococcus canis]